MNRRSFLSTGASALAAAALIKQGHTQMLRGQAPGGPFQPNWESLKAYQTPEWYRDAKLGLLGFRMMGVARLGRPPQHPKAFRTTFQQLEMLFR